MVDQRRQRHAERRPVHRPSSARPAQLERSSPGSGILGRRRVIAAMGAGRYRRCWGRFESRHYRFDPWSRAGSGVATARHASMSRRARAARRARAVRRRWPRSEPAATEPAPSATAVVRPVRVNRGVGCSTPIPRLTNPCKENHLSYVTCEETLFRHPTVFRRPGGDKRRSRRPIGAHQAEEVAPAAGAFLAGAFFTGAFLAAALRTGAVWPAGLRTGFADFTVSMTGPTLS